MATVTGSLVFATGNFVITSSLPMDASERPSIENESVTKNLINRFVVGFGNAIGCSLANRISSAPAITRSPHDWPSSEK